MKFHSYTNGNFSSLWVQDREDYNVLTNYIATSTFQFNLSLLAYAIMSNHIHLVVDAQSEKVAHQHIDSIKMRYGRWLSRKYHINGLLARVPTAVRPIKDMEELRKVIAYVIANPLEIDNTISFYGYEWSSGDCYFTPDETSNRLLPSSSFSLRKLRKILHSRMPPPKNILISEDGVIAKKSFVDYKQVNALFQNYNKLSYYVYASTKAKERKSENSMVKFKDNVLSSMIGEICASMYNCKNPLMLDSVDFEWLVKDLNQKYGASPKQLSRVLNVKQDAIESILGLRI